MDKEELKRLAQDKKFITGVYNYCDRWCERCPVTSRCLNFAMSDERSGDPETLDPKNQAFWTKLTATLQASLELLKEMAEEEGIDIDSLDGDETDEVRFDEEILSSHRCCRWAEAYGKMADEWFSSQIDLFGGPESVPELVAESPEQATGPGEAVEVIRWYQHFIHVKLMRAVRGERHEESGLPDEFSKDSDGSAKVALIAIDRSTGAWGEIRNQIPFGIEEIDSILVHLRGLREEVEKTFPDARAFIRPGFDKIDLNG
jgi:hypothetical protein